MGGPASHFLQLYETQNYNLDCNDLLAVADALYGVVPKGNGGA